MFSVFFCLRAFVIRIYMYIGKAIMVWERHSGPTPTEKTGPDNDHTFERYNNSGHYLFVNMNQHAMNDDKRKLSGFASNAVINSIVFNPPPYAHLNTSSIYQHSCLVCVTMHSFCRFLSILLLFPPS